MSEEDLELPYNAGDPVAVAKRKVTAKHKQKELDEFTSAMMDTSQGRGWMWDILTATKVFQTVFSTRALEMAFNEGQRNVGLRLMADLMRVSPDQYITMARENGDRHE